MVCSRTSISFKVCAVFCATSLVIAAAETSLTPPDPLAAAKRDYEAFKTDGPHAAPQGALNLRQPLPTLETSADAPPIPSPIQRARRLETLRAQKSAARSENWLIEGVMNNSGSSPARVGQSRGDKSAAGQEASSKDAFFNEEPTAVRLSDRGDFGMREIDATRESSATRSIETYNPLDSYMSKWMTPGDFRLLKANSDHARLVGNAPTSTAFQSLTSDSLSSVIPVPSQIELGFLQRATPLGTNSDNPYIGELAVPLAPVSVFSAPTAPEPVSPSLMPTLPALSPTIDRTVQPPAKPSLAEALRADDEAKFFKQLKRF